LLVLKKAPAPLNGAKATSSTQNSRSSTKTRRNNGAQRQNIGERTHAECWRSHSAITNFLILSLVADRVAFTEKFVATECCDQNAASVRSPERSAKEFRFNQTNLPTARKLFGVAGLTQKQNQQGVKNNLWQQLM